jgi:hypothetical protein
MFRNLKIMLKFKFGKGIRLRRKTCPICRKKHIMIGTNISEYVMVSNTLRTIRYVDLCKHCTKAFRNIGSDLGMDVDGDTATMVLGLHTD